MIIRRGYNPYNLTSIKAYTPKRDKSVRLGVLFLCLASGCPSCYMGPCSEALMSIYKLTYKPILSHCEGVLFLPYLK